MTLYYAILAVANMMAIQSNQSASDSAASAAIDEEATMLTNAQTASTEAMSNVISAQNTSSNSDSSSSTNNNMTEAQQVESTETTLFQSQQKFISSMATVFTNLVSGPDTNNLKTDGTIGNMILQILSKTSSMLGTYY